ncbi:MAG: TlpA disulfide reductase family protein [Candidatus Aminicenantes bacterium]|nr:TlpA disulfide reductase family protein [Candidatus Aminicenantes bacterium]
MASKIWPALFLLLTLSFCHSRSALEESRQMAKAYAECIAKYDRLAKELDRGMKNIRPGRDLDKMFAAYTRLQAEKKAALSALLQEKEGRAGSDQLDLLRSKIKIEVGRFDDAEKIIDRLSQARSELALEAKLQKVIINLIRRRSTDAQNLFREIEPRLKKDTQFFDIYLAFAFSSPQRAVREEYSLKFLASPDLPTTLLPYKTRVYANLAALAKDERQPEKAKEYLKKAMALNSDPDLQANLQAEFKQLALLNQPAPPLQAETWFNSPPLNLAFLRGQVVVIDFWAPWCDPCREVMPVLLDEYRQWQGKGLQIIGYSKLYGRYNDDTVKREMVSVAEELALIKNYLGKKTITYPIAIAVEGLSFDAYAVTAIPTLVFINRRGVVVHFKSGAGNSRQISDLIKSLLAEK